MLLISQRRHLSVWERGDPKWRVYGILRLPHRYKGLKLNADFEQLSIEMSIPLADLPSPFKGRMTVWNIVFLVLFFPLAGNKVKLRAVVSQQHYGPHRCHKLYLVSLFFLSHYCLPYFLTAFSAATSFTSQSLTSIFSVAKRSLRTSLSKNCMILLKSHLYHNFII